MSTSKKPRHRHTSEQLEQLNSLYAIDDHPSLEQRQILAEALGMETKTVNSWFQNKRASQAKKANRISAKRGPGAGHDGDDYEPDGFATNYGSKLSKEQADALRQFYVANNMPTPIERDMLANQLGLSIQATNNWFQSQNGPAMLPEEQIAEMPHHYISYPPPSSHPSLPPLPPASTHPSIPTISMYQRPPSATPEISSKSALRRSTTPYSTPPNTTRRRSRPEPHQLAALTALFNKTENPSIHDRTVLAAETGMDIDRVSNWFRNMRQNGKRRQRSESDPDDGASERDSMSSPRTSPSPAANSFEDHRRRTSNSTRSPDSDMGSEEEQEAVTPPPLSVHGEDQSDSASFPPTHESRFVIPNKWIDNDPTARAALDQRSAIDVEGALLLLGFHSSYGADS